MESLRAYRPNDGWDLLHLAELLVFFAEDGSALARQAVEEKDRELLAYMQHMSHRPDPVCHELSDLAQLGLVVADDRASVLCIAADFGAPYQEKPYLPEGDFAWHFAAKGSRYPKDLKHVAMKNPDIACFLEWGLQWIQPIVSNL